MSHLSSEILPVEQLNHRMKQSGAGAFVSFEGRVRDSNEGKKVLRLEYEAVKSLAQKEIDKILIEAGRRFAVIDVQAQHRVGMLEIGDVAVWVGILAAHRHEAFIACRFVIDEIKKRVPIWKKEHYVDGTAVWVNCAGQDHQLEHPSPADESEYYSRQTILPQLGKDGQKKLRDARVFILGAGGLGSPAILYLAAAGVGRIGICDGDKVETSNLHRQILYTMADVGKPKALIAAEKARQLNPFIEIASYDCWLSANNIESLIDSYDILLDCSDNFGSKFLLSDAAYLKNKILVHAGVYQFEGQLFAFDRAAGGQCLRCLWGDSPSVSTIKSCAQSGIVGAVPGTIGSLQAVETIKIICGLPELLFDKILLLDLLSFKSRHIKPLKSTDCSLCGNHPTIISLEPSLYRETVCDDKDFEVDLASLSANELATTCVIDIRELAEASSDELPHAEKRPMSKLNPDCPDLDAAKNYILICQRGVRSRQLVQILRSRGHVNVFSARGGMDAVNRRVDSECFN